MRFHPPPAAQPQPRGGFTDEDLSWAWWPGFVLKAMTCFRGLQYRAAVTQGSRSGGR
jgi:hypothetical protein